MASLSLPRVLQLKKNSLDAERESFEKFQTLAIQKAINSVETPVKEKHVRSTIIGTFQEQSAITYWMVAVRLPLQDNRIVSWKFCHVTHKLLREGHPACLDDSQRHISMIQNLGKLWVHLREGYGKLIHLYCNLLICKLQFHARNPRIPGNMQLASDELDAISENDVNNYFQLCVELFDYMDEILNLQAAVFSSLGNARANSMTASGQCRLAALIPCAQDASHIYDCNVRLLFRLHAALPADTLAGHRERFRQQFKKLSEFYKHASSLQYYRNLLTLPSLPSSPPNFLLQSDFGTYVTPVVSIPEPVPDEPDTVGSLIDTSDTVSQSTTPDQLDFIDTRTTPSPQPDPLFERDRLIEHLQAELKIMRSDIKQLVQERSSMLDSMQEHCNRLENQLQHTKTELEEEKHKAEKISAQTPEISQKLSETEEKAKLTDEKFQKLKGAYTQLREEHINLIRQKAEVDKISTGLRSAATEFEATKIALQEQLRDRDKDVELLQQSASKAEELESYKAEISSIRDELIQSKQEVAKLENLRVTMEALQTQKDKEASEAQEKLSQLSNEITMLSSNIEKLSNEKQETEVELIKLKEDYVREEKQREEDHKRILDEKEAAFEELNVMVEHHKKEKELMVNKLDRSEKDRLTAECELQDLLQQNSGLEQILDSTKKQLQETQKELEKQRVLVLSSACAAAMEIIKDSFGTLERSDQIESNRITAGLADCAFAELAKITQVEGSEERIAQSALLAAYSTAQLTSYVTEINNTSTNVEVADKMTSDCRDMLDTTKQCLESLQSGKLDLSKPDEAKKRIDALLLSTSAVEKKNSGARNVDDELADMDKAIEDAAGRIEEMLAASRAADSGVKLEVNGKILDACTTLMGAVKILVQDARKLQNELGDVKTRQKMYRRNPQWSEGLISAAKAVVFAAKLLVTSADEAVVGAGPVEGVSAAAQEVAGSTAQLVAASRARAPPGSGALARLTQASRSVATATGAVVATVKAAATLVNEQEALDTSALTLTATRRLEMESKVRSLELESALDAERVRLAALRRRHYQLAQQEENGNMTNGRG